MFDSVTSNLENCKVLTTKMSVISPFFVDEYNHETTDQTKPSYII